MAHRRFLRIGPAALVVATLLASTGCREAPRQEQPEPQQAQPAPEPQVRDGPPSLPIPMPPLDRERLLIAAVRAASASAAGLDDRERQDELAGERFVFRFRFGCGGPAEEGPRRWSYDPDGEVLRAQFEPAPAQPDAKDDQGDEESSASFAVERPWLLRSVCPANAAASPQAAADGQVFLVQRFTEEESRATRLPDVFRITQRVVPENAPREGLDFVLSGKLEPGADGRVITCVPVPTGGRPNCTISVSIESARLQDPVSGKEFATWGD